jgi:hypothetical protein
VQRLCEQNKLDKKIQTICINCRPKKEWHK